MDIAVLDNPLYPPTDLYRLRFSFSNSYPIEPPEVVFRPAPDRPIPIHPHIYSNGIICLDLLDTQGWSPVHNVESVCISIQSMLASNTKNESEYFSMHASMIQTRNRHVTDGDISQDLRVTASLCATTVRDLETSTSSTMILAYKWQAWTF